MRDCGLLLEGLVVANLSTSVGAARMAVLDGRDGVSEWIRRAGYWEWRSPDAMLSSRSGAAVTGLPPPGAGVFLDIGANLGYYSLLYAMAGWTAIAVEPMLQNRRALRASLCLNPRLAPRVHVISTALASPSEFGPCVATTLLRNGGNGRLACGAAARHINCTTEVGIGRCRDGRVSAACRGGSYDIRACEDVPQMPLDALLRPGGRLHRLLGGPVGAQPGEPPDQPGAQPPRIDVVKIDVEGFECAVLSGAQALFDAKARPRFLQIEGNDRRSNRCARAEAARHGYAVREERSDIADLNLFLYAE